MSLEKDYLKDLFTDEVKGCLKSDGDPVGTAANAVSEHNTSNDAHSDIRLLLAGLTSRLNALADSDDETLDQVSELVAYIKANRELIESVTTGKVSVSDIINNLTTNISNKPLSAAQGVALKALIDAITVPTKVSELQNDAGYLTQHQDISGKANASDLTAHTSDNTIHITAAERTKWNQAVTDVVIPDYWKEAVDALEYKIKERLNEAGSEAFMVLWGADIHGYQAKTKYIGEIVRYAANKYNIPFVLFSGDIMSQASHSSEANVIAEYDAINKMLSPISSDQLLMEKGNHDGAWGSPVDIDGTATYYLKNIGTKKIYNNLFRRQALDKNKVFGGNGTYFYVDFHDVRIIMLNSHTDGDESVDDNGWAVYNPMKNIVFGTEQLSWLANVALDVPEGKRIIVSAHVGLTAGDAVLLTEILNAYNNRATYTGSVNLQGTYWGKGLTDSPYITSSVNVDFSNAKGEVVLYLHGHIHKDTISTLNTFALASITTAGGDVRDTNPPTRTVGTATETALDLVIMSKTAINFIRIGAGSDRVIPLDNSVYYSISNHLTNVSTSNSAGTVKSGMSYTATLSANSGYAISSVTVTMGGIDITSTAYANGVITISNVTGDIVITAAAEATGSTSGYTNLLDTIGYEDGMRLSGSTGETKAAEGRVTTGYIPIGAGDVIRIKGMTFPSSEDGTYPCVAYNYDTKAYISAAYVYEGRPAFQAMTFAVDGDLLTITRNNGVGSIYIRVTGGATTGAGLIITKNEEITNIASYTNLADTTSSDWLTNYRYNSGGTLAAVSGGTTPLIMTNYLDVSQVTDFHIKGIDLISDYTSGNNYGRVYLYDSSKNYVGFCYTSVENNAASVFNYLETASYDETVKILHWATAKENVNNQKTNTLLSAQDISFIRFGGLCQDASQVVITADEKIADVMSYTNLADPTSEDWLVGYRLTSAATPSESSGSTVSNYIPVSAGDAVYIKGTPSFDTNNSDRIILYNSEKGGLHIQYTQFWLEHGVDNEFGYMRKISDGYYVIHINKSSGAYIRMSFATPTNTDDIIITRNEPIE